MMRVETATHNVQTIGKQYIDMISPAVTVLDLVKMVPSMNVSTQDSSGMQGGSIKIRGLTDSDMGLLLDGVAVGSATYISESADSENVESVVITPGSSAIDLPVTAAAAGVMQEQTHTPGKKMGGTVDFSYGTNNLSREFIRLESGEIGNTGLRGYLSFSNSHARSWIGAGINERKHLDFGLQKDWANGSKNSVFISWNYEDFIIDVYPTAAQFYKYKHTGIGYDRDAEYTPGKSTSGNYWKNNDDHWHQIYLSAPQHFVLTHRVSLDLNPYYLLGRGWDGYSGGLTSATGTQYYYADGTKAAAGTQLTGYYQQYADDKLGLVAKIGADLDRHNHLTFGYWFEHESNVYGSPRSFTLADGSNPSPNAAVTMAFVKNSAGKLVRSTTYVDAGTNLNGLFIQDSAKYLHDKLTVTAGFKYVMTNFWDRVTALTSYTAKGTNTTAPLPQLSMGYRFNDHHQLYINVEGDFRQPSAASLTLDSKGQFAKPQYSIKEELGYRYNDDVIIADIAFFNMNITNRLLTTYLTSTQTGTTNAGNQTSRGVDISLSTHPWHHLSPYGGFEYLHATTDNNITYVNSYLPTKGKQAIASPKFMASLGLTYDDSHFFANLGIKYVGAQSVTLVADQRMPGYFTDSLALGYHFKPLWRARTPTVRLNFRNLTGSIVRSGTYGVATNCYAVTLLDGTAGPVAGSGAQFIVEPRFSMTGTVSTDF